MFEDMFPSLGDYDFNDFVLGYRVQIPFRSGRRGKSVIDEAIQFFLFAVVCLHHTHFSRMM